jgi:hypothetical protein
MKLQMNLVRLVREEDGNCAKVHHKNCSKQMKRNVCSKRLHTSGNACGAAVALAAVVVVGTSKVILSGVPREQQYTLDKSTGALVEQR